MEGERPRERKRERAVLRKKVKDWHTLKIV